MIDVAISQITQELELTQWQVRATVAMLSDGATVPFIARYRKEATGNLDEVLIVSIRDRLSKLQELWGRRDAILHSLEERELLTEALRKTILSAETMAVLEDVFLPYRPKRRTRATIARERGLESLAMHLWNQQEHDVKLAASGYINPELGVESVEDALDGARDIIAEWISEDSAARKEIRQLFWSHGTFCSDVVRGKSAEAAKYRDYFEWEEPITDIPSHRVMAMLRGERETLLSIRITPPAVQAMLILENLFVTRDTEASQQVQFAVQDGYKRLLETSMETEVRKDIRVRAEHAAIGVFADNLRELLLTPALGQKVVLALDPGFRTGCKLVCLDQQGKLLHHDTVYPLLGARSEKEAAEKIDHLCRQFDVEVIAVGNGTGGRETESFLRGLELHNRIPVIMTNENGASVYSASDLARTEFPDQDITVRGAVSIGRRLMDPLAELIKIDPNAIGVGQYQHDVDQKALRRRLDDVVVSCVNKVGVELNTASVELLSYVSGLGPHLAKAIVAYRNIHGPFASRESLKKVQRLGPKAFVQAAGFLRITGGTHPLDASAVHPESYAVAEAIAKDTGQTLEELIGDLGISEQIDLQRYVNDKVGLPTLKDIIEELARPGRDPRQEYEPFYFAEGVTTIADLAVGLRIPGIVTNVTGFGAFVDIGIHQDGLVHVSQLSGHFVRNPADIVKVQQRVWVTVLAVDIERRRVSLSMKG